MGSGGETRGLAANHDEISSLKPARGKRAEAESILYKAYFRDKKKEQRKTEVRRSGSS